MNSQIASEAASVSGSQPGSTGVGFAVSSDTVAEAVKKIEAGNGVASTSTSRSAVQLEAERAQSEGSATQSPYGRRSPYGVERGGSGEVETEAGGASEATRVEGNSGMNGVEEGAIESGGSVAGREGQVVIVP